ncbi:MAG TPA: UDP-N-acetylmuramoyl-L-alanyl-D-glutamate--2,6-diaminopimelate ligase [Firmicutes bacterium]|nr:UDP-N-acetylmuramoyl-L-alanyl-D-glutamate--2,6-diaminopimelate ligase [Bacillota bacterium]
MLQLSELLIGIGACVRQGDPNIQISGIAHDSRQVKHGDLFICIKGYHSDGHDYIAEAARAGAAAVLIQEDRSFPAGLTVVQTDSTVAAMASISDIFYEHPSGKLRLLGIIGTKGKTTSTYMCKSIYEAAGYKGGLIGTIRNIVGDQEVPSRNTTPVSPDLQALLAQMVSAGVSHVAMEVSSHAVALNRIARCDFAGGIFTNITSDHLDFHKTFDEYLKAKVRFFELLSPDAYAVINIDSPSASAFLEACRCKIFTYGIQGRKQSDFYATDLVLGPGSSHFTVVTPQQSFPIKMHLAGKFNIYNALGVITAMIAEGIAPEAISRGLEALPGVPGRFERVPNSMGRTVIVDYAHTADSLENVLQTAREISRGRVIVVFGCGGDRDRSKRPVMGHVAAQLADYVVITSDNPRTEDPAMILDEIIPGVISGGKEAGQYTVIADRQEAIHYAINRQRPEDIVVIAGKGHETYQILRDRTIHFDDREVVRAALEALS